MSNLPETELFHKAIKHWWAFKKSAAPKKAQGGMRDANLHGKTMDGFALSIRDFLIGLNVKPEHIFAGGHLSTSPSILPSYFRPSKNWDLIALANSRFHSAKGDKGEPVLYADMESTRNPFGRRPHPGSRIHLTSRKPIRQKTAAKTRRGTDK